ncbi:hypothetical protein PY093_02570 [Cytobacillus sp. S13-E01]|uniref:hypothetical protein n=1 Tax=Cytobacillus sp. S13-E01 TaxID=3031326 RepID=UPI0023D7C680|nr:hypothetical protein [Cytobacillus sp. S13-E01]MDF0725597.1 hypothetical protein [Cytobacillus sp. S13-E01]
MKSIPFYLLFIFSLAFVLITFLTNNNDEEITRDNNVNQKQPNLPIELSNNEKEIFTEFVRNVQLSSQIMKELDLLLEEQQKYDELEGAIEAMSIAHEETLIVVSKILNDPITENKELNDLQNYITKLLTDYTAGLSLQLEGIEKGDSKKVQKGYSLSTSAKEKLFKLKKDVEQI